MSYSTVGAVCINTHYRKTAYSCACNLKLSVSNIEDTPKWRRKVVRKTRVRCYFPRLSLAHRKGDLWLTTEI